MCFYHLHLQLDISLDCEGICCVLKAKTTWYGSMYHRSFCPITPKSIRSFLISLEGESVISIVERCLFRQPMGTCDRRVGTCTVNCARSLRGDGLAIPSY